MMPMRELQAYVAELPRVEAIESMLAVERLMVGTNQMRPSDRGATLRRWRDDSGARPVRAKDPAMRAHLAAAAGLAVRTVKRG